MTPSKQGQTSSNSSYLPHLNCCTSISRSIQHSHSHCWHDMHCILLFITPRQICNQPLWVHSFWTKGCITLPWSTTTLPHDHFKCWNLISNICFPHIWQAKKCGKTWGHRTCSKQVLVTFALLDQLADGLFISNITMPHPTHTTVSCLYRHWCETNQAGWHYISHSSCRCLPGTFHGFPP